MTQDVDVLSPRAHELVEELRQHLTAKFSIALRVRQVKGGRGFRLYQVRQPKNRHLVDVRWVETLPPHKSIDSVLVIEPVHLIAQKVLSMMGRRKTAKGVMDLADLRRLLLAFPELKHAQGEVHERLKSLGASEDVLGEWNDLAAEEILVEDEDAQF